MGKGGGVGQFFNFSSQVVADGWGRRAFLRAWWRKSERDRRWTPPVYALLYRALVRRDHAHVARFAPRLIELHAVERPQRAQPSEFGSGALNLSAGEVCVGQVALLLDAAFETAHVALLEVANDTECLEKLLEVATVQATEAGCSRLLLTTGLAPAFPTGVLASHFHLPPPLHSAYNAPFLAELLEAECEALLPRRIWLAPVVADDAAVEQQAELTIAVTSAARLAGDLAPLLLALWEQGAAADLGLRPPDALEIAFLLEQWRVAPLTLLLASWADEPVGCALLQGDVRAALRRLRGGFAPWAWLWMAQRPLPAAAEGRILLGGVRYDAAGQGVGAALWRACHAHARAAGWQTLQVGPVDEGDPLEAFLAARGAEPRQRSLLYAVGSRRDGSQSDDAQSDDNVGFMGDDW